MLERRGFLCGGSNKQIALSTADGPSVNSSSLSVSDHFCSPPSRVRDPNIAPRGKLNGQALHLLLDDADEVLRRTTPTVGFTNDATLCMEDIWELIHQSMQV